MTRTIPAAIAALLVSTLAFAAKAPVFQTAEGAIRGFDPVAYFTEGKPVKGSARYTVEYQGATWHFASAANRDRFAAAPADHAPAYGGYCAYAVGNGYTAPIDPEAWSLVDGRLFLNYSKGVQAKWDEKRAHYIREGDANWPGVLD